jgi:4-amino-4-deoxy-L-arabinose transferase-like glycosyltransferase
VSASVAQAGEAGVHPARTVRHPERWLVAIVLFAVVLRVVNVVWIAPWPPERLDDSAFFNVQAAVIAQGHGFISPLDFLFRHQSLPSAAHPPVYPLVLAGLHLLGGTGQVAQRLTGVAFGAATVVLLWVLGRRLGGERVGLIAAGLAAVYPVLITADGALMSESLFGMLVALVLLAALRLFDAPSAGRALLLGALIAVAALTRGEALLFVVLLLVPLLRRPGGWRLAVAACAAVAVVLAPWTIRNVHAFHALVLISTNQASAVAGANCPSTWYTGEIGSWDNACVYNRDPKQATARNEAVRFNLAERAGLRYATHHIARAPVVVAARLARVWGLRKGVLVGSLPRITGRAPWLLGVGYVMYYVLAVLAIGGFVLLRRRRVPVWILLSTVVLVTIEAVLVYGDVRFRQPAELTLVLFAAVAVDGLWRAR